MNYFKIQAVLVSGSTIVATAIQSFTLKNIFEDIDGIYVLVSI